MTGLSVGGSRWGCSVSIFAIARFLSLKFLGSIAQFGNFLGAALQQLLPLL